MNTDIEYLRTLETDLRDAAARERSRAATPSPRRHLPRLAWGTVAAAIVPLLVVAGLVGWLVTGGGDEASTLRRSLGAGGGRASYSAAPASGESGLDQVSGPVAAASGSTASGPAASVPTGDVAKIIRDGTISIEVPEDDFSKGFAAVTRVAESNGGFVLSSQTRGRRAGTLTLRIPARRFDQAMLALREVGTVQAQSVAGKDVTAQFVDLKARLKNATAQRNALRALMTRATTIAETLAVQNRLSATQLQIEQIQGQMNFIRDQVAEATIRVDLRERNAIERDLPSVRNPSLGTAWDRAVQGSLNVVAAVVVGLGYLVPIGVLGLAVWLAAMVVLTARRRRSAR